MTISHFGPSVDRADAEMSTIQSQHRRQAPVGNSGGNMDQGSRSPPTAFNPEELERPRQVHVDAARRIASLTARQHQILKLVLDGQANKIIAAILGISQRTVESHRAEIMKKTGTRCIATLTRFAIAAGFDDTWGDTSSNSSAQL